MIFQFYGGRYGGGGFSNFLYYLDLYGIRDVILPFLLFFTVLFAVLQKIKLFGSDESTKKYNLVLSLVIAALVVIPHITGYYPAGQDIVVIVNNVIPEIALLVVGIVMLLMMIGLLGVGPSRFFQSLIAWVSIGIVIIFFVNAISPVSWVRWIPPVLQDSLIILLVIGILIYFVSRPGRTEQGELEMRRLSMQEAENWWNRIFGGGTRGAGQPGRPPGAHG